MMHFRILSIGIVLALLGGNVPAVQAQNIFGGDSCRTKVNNGISREQRLYRAMLLGKPYARHAPVNDIRYDKDGVAWIKTGLTGTPWKNMDSVQSGLSWSDQIMDQEDEHNAFMPIRGIFETKRVTTSELLPYALQSIRALDCRLETICTIAERSVLEEGDTPKNIGDLEAPGCIKFTNLESFPACHVEHVGDLGDTISYCKDISRQLLEREISLLKLLTEYDSGYRSLLQFAGNFDAFLREMRSPLTATLRQAASMIGQLGRIPCFLSSCDIAPGTE